MRVGELSRRTSVSTRLLRYYEQQGLLRPQRQANGYREFAESDVDAVLRIRALLGVGLSTKVIGEILHCVHRDDDRITTSGCDEVSSRLRDEIDRIDSTIAGLQQTRRTLTELID